MPLLFDGLFCSIQASALALSVTVEQTTGGAVIVHVCEAGDASGLPAASVARTANVCVADAEAGVRLRRGARGEGAHASSEQPNVEPDSFEVNVKFAVVALPFAGSGEPRVVSGAVVSGGGGAVTLHVWLAGEPSVLPAASVARTAKVWLPSRARCTPWRGAGGTGSAVERAGERGAGLVEVKAKVAVVGALPAAGDDRRHRRRRVGRRRRPARRAEGQHEHRTVAAVVAAVELLRQLRPALGGVADQEAVVRAGGVGRLTCPVTVHWR